MRGLLADAARAIIGILDRQTDGTPGERAGFASARAII